MLLPYNVNSQVSCLVFLCCGRLRNIFIYIYLTFILHVSDLPAPERRAHHQGQAGRGRGEGAEGGGTGEAAWC